MTWLATVRFHLRTLFAKRKLDEQLSEEVRAHVEMATEANLAKGMSADEARYAALREFGNVAGVQERTRDERGWVWLEQGWQDVRYALRQLRRAKAFTLVAVLTLALGIGATTGIYSVVVTVLLDPIPGTEPGRLLQIGQLVQRQNRPGPEQTGVSPPVLEVLEANQNLFDQFAWFDSAQLEQKGEDFTTIVFGTRASVGFFELLGVRPQLGRTFAADEAVAFESGKPTKDSVLVLSHDWWQSQFGGDANVLGQIVELGGHQFTIVGVMPAHFRYPTYSNRYWVPALAERPRPKRMTVANTRVIVRLKQGVMLSQVQAMLETLTQRLMQDYPADRWGYGQLWRRTSGGLRLWAAPLLAQFQDGRAADELRRTLFGFVAAVSFVLLIVCANMANLALARTERRQHELAVRAALGASRMRLARQLLTENLLLAGLGGSAGLLVTIWVMNALGALSSMPRLRPLEVDGVVLGIALGVTLFAGLASGLAPAWQAGRPRLNDTLAQGAAGATGVFRRGRLQRGLVVVEVALAVVLLSGAGLMIRSVVRLLHVEPGFDPVNLISVNVSFDKPGRTPEDKTAARNARMFQAQERLAALPGVSAVGVFKDGWPPEQVMVEGRTEPVLVNRSHCGWGKSDFFQAARIPLVSGRHFVPGDLGEQVRTILVNETLAALCWPGEEAVGKRFRALDQKGEPVYEVVGVTKDVRLYRYAEAQQPAFYRPFTEASVVGLPEILVVRTQVAPDGIITAIRNELKSVDPKMHLPHVESFQQRLNDSTQAHRTYRNYLMMFAGGGLLLAAIGIYGVLAYAVDGRTREIGIRLAIGAQPHDVVALVMRQGVALILAGVGLGLLVSFWLTRYLQKQLYEVSAGDPVVLLGAVTVLLIVGVCACWLPARRAAKVDPVVALRAE